MKRCLVAVMALLALMAASGPCLGAVVISGGPGGGNPDENVLFQGAGVVLGPGNLVTGRTNQSDWLLDFTSSDSLVGNGGQARIEGNGGTSYSDLNMTNFRDPSGPFVVDILDLKFNVDASANGTIKLEAFDASNVSLTNATFALAQNGNNFFRVTGSGGMSFARLQITIVGGGNIIEKVEQVRITGKSHAGPPTNVPEPASMAVWSLLGLAVVGGRRLQKKRRAEA